MEAGQAAHVIEDFCSKLTPPRLSRTSGSRFLEPFEALEAVLGQPGGLGGRRAQGRRPASDVRVAHKGTKSYVDGDG